MKVLAIETSSSRINICATSGEELQLDEHYFSPRRETGPLYSLVERALQKFGFPDRIAVGTGPGSYNGIRAGLSLACGLETALSIPCGGWSSLLALEPERKIVCGDARSGQLYFTMVEDHSFLLEPVLIPASELSIWLARHSDCPAWRIGCSSDALSHLPPIWPQAIFLANVCRNSSTMPSPQPTYLKPPHITSPKN